MGVGIFTGVPKSLNGVNKLLQMMEWQSGEGEENEGMIGNYINFGAIGKDHVVDAHTGPDGEKIEQDDVFILIAPQSMVGIESSIMGPLAEMVEAAGDRPVILLNPDLTDKVCVCVCCRLWLINLRKRLTHIPFPLHLQVSPQGQQSVRGRKQRIEFAER